MSLPLTSPPLFVVGADRSGTTLLRSLLSAHSAIAVTPETHFLTWAENKGGLEREAPANFERFWRHYTDSIRFKDLDVDAGRCRALIDGQGAPTYRAIFGALLAAYGERTGKPRVGEKTPNHVHHLARLLAWFPEARVVVLRRDPRAVVASQLRSPWVQNRITPPSLRRGLLVGSRPYEFAACVEGWARIYEEVVPVWEGDPRVLLVSYEELVGDVEGELRRVCAFLEEPFERAMVARRTSETVPVPAGTAEIGDEAWRAWRREHHASTLRPVSSAAVDKWRGELEESEIAAIEGRCGRGMEAGGYAFSAPERERRKGRMIVSAIAALGRLEAGARAAVDGARGGTKSALRPAYHALRRAL